MKSRLKSRGDSLSLWNDQKATRNDDEDRITRNQSQGTNSLEQEINENDDDNEKELVSIVYASIGELPAFLFGWMDILVNITAISACRYKRCCIQTNIH